MVRGLCFRYKPVEFWSRPTRERSSKGCRMRDDWGWNNDCKRNRSGMEAGVLNEDWGNRGDEVGWD